MNPVCVSLFDRKAGVFQCPLFYPDRVTAERAFCALLAEGSSTPAQWPDDFELYECGTFDPRFGSVIPLEHPVLIITGQSALLAVSRLRRLGVELTRGQVAPFEDKAASRPDASDAGGQLPTVSSDSECGSVHSSSAPDDTPSLPFE